MNKAILIVSVTFSPRPAFCWIVGRFLILENSLYTKEIRLWLISIHPFDFIRSIYISILIFTESNLLVSYLASGLSVLFKKTFLTKYCIYMEPQSTVLVWQPLHRDPDT